MQDKYISHLFGKQILYAIEAESVIYFENETVLSDQCREESVKT